MRLGVFDYLRARHLRKRLSCLALRLRDRCEFHGYQDFFFQGPVGVPVPGMPRCDQRNDRRTRAKVWPEKVYLGTCLARDCTLSTEFSWSELAAEKASIVQVLRNVEVQGSGFLVLR